MNIHGKIGEDQIGPEAIKELSKTLKSNTKITVLYLGMIGAVFM